MSGNQEQKGEISPQNIRRQFNRLKRLNLASLFTERAVPKILAPAVIGTGFLAVTWAGLWTVLPLEAKIIGVVAFAAAAAVSPFLIKSGSLLVKKKDAIKRMDAPFAESGARPAEIIDGRLHKSPAQSSATNQILWQHHIKRTWSEWGDKLKASAPKLNLNKYDPLKMRFILPICAGLAGIHAGDQWQSRLAHAADWTRPPAPPAPEEPLDIRAWVTPPNLPHLAPTYLNTDIPDPVVTAPAEGDITEAAPADEAAPAHPAQAEPAAPAPQPVTVHEGSMLTIIIAGGNAPIRHNGQVIEATTILEADDDTGRITAEYQIPLQEGEMDIQIENGPSWHITVSPDANPNANIVNIAPNPDNPNSLNIICNADDDFGITGGRIIMRVPGAEANDDASTAPRSDEARLPTINLPRNRICPTPQ